MMSAQFFLKLFPLILIPKFIYLKSAKLRYFLKNFPLMS